MNNSAMLNFGLYRPYGSQSSNLATSPMGLCVKSNQRFPKMPV